MARKRGANFDAVNPVYALVNKTTNEPVVENSQVLTYPSRQLARECKEEGEKVVKAKLVLL